jgi:glycosyltransferase involved in cell wall biosynthesis
MISGTSAPPVSGSISVALCTYNGDRYLAEQLRSLVDQTLRPSELVVVDDGSSDGTEVIVRDFAATAPFPVRWYRNESRLGVVRNFQRAIGMTRSEVIFLCDQDDVWLPEKIEKTVALFDSPEVLMVHTDGRLVDATLRDLGVGLLEALELAAWERELFERERGYEVLLRRSLVTGATAAVRRSLYDAALPFAQGWVHDEWLAVLAALLGRVRRVDLPLLLYRQHGRNQIGARKRSWSERYVPRSRWGRELHRARARLLQEVRHHIATRGLAVLEPRRRELDEAICHAQFRAEVPQPLAHRFLAVMRELASGRYRRYSNGWKGALRDLVEPSLPEPGGGSGGRRSLPAEQPVPHAAEQRTEPSPPRRDLRHETRTKPE